MYQEEEGTPDIKTHKITEKSAFHSLTFAIDKSTVKSMQRSGIEAIRTLIQVCVGPGRKPRRPVSSQRGSYGTVVYFAIFGDGECKSFVVVHLQKLDSLSPSLMMTVKRIKMRFSTIVHYHT